MADIQRSAFMLSSATLMLTPFGGATLPWDLVPATHSVGMCREVTINVDSSTIDLTNGVAQALVESRKTNVQAMISGKVYEHNAANLLYAQGLTGTVATVKRGVLATAAAAAATSLSINGAAQGDAAAISATADIPSGAVLIIQSATDPSKCFATKTTAATTGTGPYSATIASPYAIPTGMSFAIGDIVYVANELGVADTTADQLFSVKIVGSLSAFDRPVTAIFPKVRVTKGFQLAFTEGEYGSMPWELKPLLLSSSEATGRLADIGTKRPGLVYALG